MSDKETDLERKARLWDRVVEEAGKGHATATGLGSTIKRLVAANSR